MTKEEIALQLTLAKLPSLQKTMCTNSYDDNIEYNKELGIQVASLYTTIYQNLNCLDVQHPSLDESVSKIQTF
ncbi:MAG: hypothetical protein U0O04_00020 [Clostridia bacterium]